MKKLSVLFGIVLTLLVCPAIQAQACSAETGPPAYVFDIIGNSDQHSTGSHTFNGGVTEQCTYASIGNQYCQTTATATPWGTTTDTGLLSTTPLGYHVGKVAIASGSQVNPSGAASTTGTSATAVEWCLSLTCSFTVSAGPISFPSGSVWTTSQTAGPTCPAVIDTTYSAGGGGGGTCTCGCSGGGGSSPILIDISGEGFHLTSETNGVWFDIAGDGQPMHLSWTRDHSRNAFLALDRNGNGAIDNGKELFGNFTEQPSSPDPNGYLALAEFDKPENGGNGDGVIDRHDAVYSKLLLWIDENHDGNSQPNELHHLWEFGVYSLSLAYANTPYADVFGNQFRYKGKVNPLGEPTKDHVNRSSYDVFFVSGASGSPDVTRCLGVH